MDGSDVLASGTAIKWRSNILIQGDKSVTDAFLGALDPREAIILEEIARYSHEEQLRLLDWMERGPNVQIIATTRTSLFDLVRTGAFSDTLYYRLNTVFIDLSATRSSRSAA